MIYKHATRPLRCTRWRSLITFSESPPAKATEGHNPTTRRVRDVCSRLIGACMMMASISSCGTPVGANRLVEEIQVRRLVIVDQEGREGIVLSVEEGVASIILSAANQSEGALGIQAGMFAGPSIVIETASLFSELVGGRLVLQSHEPGETNSVYSSIEADAASIPAPTIRIGETVLQ